MQPASEPTTAIAPRRLRWIMWLVTGAMFMEILDGSIIATALPRMAPSFQVTALQLNLGISAYLLALGVFIPASGWVADRFGARRVFAGAIVLFTVSSALCGLSTALPVFVLLRVLQGLSGAMMVPVGRLVVMRHTPKDKLMAALSAQVWPALIAPVLGPPIGGFITAHLGWRWIFYLNVPLGLVALVMALRLVPDVRGDQRRPFDWSGFGLCGSGTFLLLLGLDRLAIRADLVPCTMLVGGAVALALAVRHFRRASHPMLHLGAFGITTFRTSARAGSLSRLSMGSVPFLLPLMLQVGFGLDPVNAGLLVLAVFVGNVGMKSVTTPILRRFSYRRVLLVNGTLCAAALLACAALRPETPLAVTVAVLLVGGMVRSMQFTAVGTMTFADVPQAQMSDANGLSSTLGQVTMATAVTLAALCVHLAQALHGPWSSVPGGAFRVAFVLMAIPALLALPDYRRLPVDAGRHFVAARRSP